jgi:hypothetical protein
VRNSKHHTRDEEEHQAEAGLAHDYLVNGFLTRVKRFYERGVLPEKREIGASFGRVSSLCFPYAED